MELLKGQTQKKDDSRSGLKIENIYSAETAIIVRSIQAITTGFMQNSRTVASQKLTCKAVKGNAFAIQATLNSVSISVHLFSFLLIIAMLYIMERM